MVLFELQTIRTNCVLEAVTFLHQLMKVQPVFRFLPGTVKIVQNPQAFHGIQLITVGIQMAETSGYVSRYPVKKGTYFLDILAMDRKGNIPLLHHAVRRIRYLVHQHGIVLCPVAIQVIIPAWNQDFLLKILTVQAFVVDGDFGGRTSIQSIQKF